MSQRGAPTQASDRTMPASAPPQATQSMIVASVPSATSRANGVIEAAMKTKIIEWSRRRIQARARGRQVTRWYRALMPKSPQIPAA